ncbi:MAG: hypothetical protein QOI41_6610, partial [Myxococcales bacterium]|nr:hypothetical protein [Myxococcales bacterium]
MSTSTSEMKKLLLTFVLAPSLTLAAAMAACTTSQDLGSRPAQVVDPLADAEATPSVDAATGSSDGASDDATDASDGRRADAMDAGPVEDPVSPDAATYVTSTVGFTVRDAYSYDRFSPTGNRQTRGIMLTSFVSACDKANANVGTRVLEVVFSAAVDPIPAVGTYPISDSLADV